MSQFLRVPVLVTLDVTAWLFAMYLAVAFRLDTLVVAPEINVNNANGDIPLYGVLIVGGVAALTHGLFAWITRLHQGRSALASFEETFLLFSVLVASSTTSLDSRSETVQRRTTRLRRQR